MAMLVPAAVQAAAEYVGTTLKGAPGSWDAGVRWVKRLLSDHPGAVLAAIAVLFLVWMAFSRRRRA
ncbi:MAG: hypothetical protein JSV95_04210 [Gemmatimonadota bacterium]|jgi:hypothetical protein|nr:MAG: hypothetical protein JSV95_04210 [Gemmatimonadota bacterium]